MPKLKASFVQRPLTCLLLNVVRQVRLGQHVAVNFSRIVIWNWRNSPHFQAGDKNWIRGCAYGDIYETRPTMLSGGTRACCKVCRSQMVGEKVRVKTRTLCHSSACHPFPLVAMQVPGMDFIFHDNISSISSSNISSNDSSRSGNSTIGRKGVAAYPSRMIVGWNTILVHRESRSSFGTCWSIVKLSCGPRCSGQ